MNSTDLRNLADAIDAANHDAEIMLARINYALSRPAPSPPDMEAASGPCCSELRDGFYVSCGCDCGNTGDTSDAEWWRGRANEWLRFKPFLDAATRP